MNILNIIFIITLIASSISIIIAMITSDKDIGASSIFCSIIFGSIYIGILISMLYLWSEPSAIDVYRGKTTLEITYKDNVPIDTVVIWKENDK